MKWGKRLLFLTCCLRFLTHSGDENLYQSHLYLGGANMNHQTVYMGKCHYHGSRIQESSSQKAGSSNLGKLVAMAVLVPIFLGNYVAKINTHASVSIQYYWAMNFRVLFYSATRATFAIFLKVPVLIATP